MSDSEDSSGDEKPFSTAEKKRYTKQWKARLRLPEARKLYHAWFKQGPMWDTMKKTDIVEQFIEHNWAYDDSLDEINKILSAEEVPEGKSTRKRKTPPTRDSDDGDTEPSKKSGKRSRKVPDTAGDNPKPIPTNEQELADLISTLVKKQVAEKLKTAETDKKQASLLTESLADETPTTISLPRLKKDARVELMKGVPRFKELPRPSDGDLSRIMNRVKDPKIQKVITKTIPQLQRMELDVYRYILHVRNAAQQGKILTTADVDTQLENINKLVFDNCRHLLFLQKQMIGELIGHAEIADLRDDVQATAFWQEEDTKAVQEAAKLKRDVYNATKPRGRGGGRGNRRFGGGRGNRFRDGRGRRGGFQRPWQSNYYNRNSQSNSFNNNQSNTNFNSSFRGRGGRGRGRD